VARFRGHLDITTLGGAGFASQRTTGENRRWNLAAYDGIRLHVDEADCVTNSNDGIVCKEWANHRDQVKDTH